MTPKYSAVNHSKCFMYNKASDNYKDKPNLSNAAIFTASTCGM